MYSPFKMKGKSPMMKALVGKQNNLPDQLKAKILAAPESPAKMKKESPAMMKKESSMKMMKKSPAKKKFNPFSAESKKMTASQKRKAQDADPSFKGNKQKVGKELKAAKSKVRSKVGGKVGKVIEKLDAGLQKFFNNPRKTNKSGGGNSGGGSKGYNSMKGDTRYTYKKNTTTGGYDFIDSKTNKKGTIKSTNKKAMDKLNSAFPMKKMKKK